MPITSVADVLAHLRDLPLLNAAQLAQLNSVRNSFPDIKTLGEELVRRGWLTAYQTKKLAEGQASELVLDQFVILDLLGEGGMGKVYKARQTTVQRIVALKVIRPEELSERGVVERFRREAKIAARLSHPNVVKLLATGEANGVHFLVIEFIQGVDLAQLVDEKGALPVALACEYVRQAALGLQHAHEQGMVHRDIKPHNLMLVQPRPGTPETGQGTIKLMDLGLARQVRGLNTGDGSGDGSLTFLGSLLGSPDYIAPEQAMNAKKVDGRADIYSLGCTLYHLLSGMPPFRSESIAEKLLKHELEEPMPILSVPFEVAEVLSKMMAKQPEARYQTPAEVAAALQPFTVSCDSGAGLPHVASSIRAPMAILVSDNTATAPLPGTPRQRSRRWLLLAGAVLGALALLAWVWR